MSGLAEVDDGQALVLPPPSAVEVAPPLTTPQPQSQPMPAAIVMQMPTRAPVDGSPYPMIFSRLKEGDVDPTTGKTIAVLIESDDDYIVYLDNELFVQWNMNDSSRLGPDTGEALNRVAVLEAIKVENRKPDQVETFRRIVGEGVARLFQKDPKAAATAFDRAEAWISARNGERARAWYLTGTLLVAVPITLLAAGLGLFYKELQQGVLGLAGTQVTIATCLGAIGAWLSVIQRQAVDLDVSAGKRLHYIEGACRIATGVLGALLVALAIHANLIMSFVENGRRWPTILVLCMVAGISERMVPGLVQRVESTALTAEQPRDKPAGN
jgi:hypothetical protein